MIFLFLAILCSASIALIFKYTEGRNLNRLAVTTVNYGTALIVSLVMLLKKGQSVAGGTLQSFIQEFRPVVLAEKQLFSPQASEIWAVIIGIFGGLFFFYSFVFYQRSVRQNGAGISGAFGKMGILLPLTLSLILWKEVPSLFQWMGITLAVCSIMLASVQLRGKQGFAFNQLLIGLFVLNGMAEFINKLFQKYAMLEYKELFLFWVFFMAFLISCLYTIKERSPISLQDIWAGLMVGIPNLFSSFFLILALNKIYASVAFPVFSAGTILVIALGSLLIFRERPKKKELISMVLIALSLVLVNV